MCVGAPGTLDDFEAWRNMVGDLSAEWQGAFLGAGAAIIGLWLLALCTTHWPKIRKAIKWPTSLLIAAALLFVAITLISFAVQRVTIPRLQWVHPTMDQDEQAKARAECRIDAFKHTSGHITVVTPYVNTCLELRGFEHKWVWEGR